MVELLEISGMNVERCPRRSCTSVFERHFGDENRCVPNGEGFPLNVLTMLHDEGGSGLLLQMTNHC